MTVIAAFVQDGKVWMGSDSAVSDGIRVQIKTETKIWQESNGMLVGAAGVMRNAQVMRHLFNPPPLSEGQDVMAYLCTDFVGVLKQVHAQAGTLHVKDNEEHSSVSALIGWRGRLFELSGYFCITEVIDPFTAIGSGGEVALGVLSVTPTMAPAERLTLAMQTAERYCQGVRGPFHILSTGDV